jgi:ribose 5-phosphate isomerase A
MNDKQLVAVHAAQKIESGMVVGLGTGSTANFFLAALADRMRDENLQITTVASSIVSHQKAKSLGLPLINLESSSHLDIYVDGADEVTDDMTLLKGRGYDLVREKLLARAADQFYVMIDPSKKVQRIGEKFPIPIEVMPFAWELVHKQLSDLGGKGNLRQTANGDGLVRTAYGSLVLDMAFPADVSSADLNTQLNNIPGIIEQGVFHQLATHILLADSGVVDEQTSNS